jgi:hypothetical protein
MSSQKARSEAETIKTSYVTMKMQLKLVLGYLKDEVPETTLARQFLQEARKTALELDKTIEGLRGMFAKIDSKLGDNAVQRLDRLHKFVLSCSGDTEGGIVDAMNEVEDTILKNEVEEAAKLLDSLQASLEQNEANADLDDIDWESLEDKIIPEPDMSSSKRVGKKKASITYLSNPENEYLAENLVGKFLKELDIEPTYVTDKMDRNGDRKLDDADIVLAFFTKDAEKSEEYVKQLEMGPRRKMIVYAESGVDLPQAIGKRFEIRYFSRDRTGELLIEIISLLKSHQAW